MRTLEKNLFQQGYQYLAGIDEAGRGPLAGPVVAAAVNLPYPLQLEGIMDSKQLNPKKRAYAYEKIFEHGYVGIGVASSTEIDDINILQATLLAMRRAVTDLEKQIPVDYCIVDGNQLIPKLDLEQQALIKGDTSCYLVAAASIIAKVYRDNLMIQYDKKFPGYGFAKHKGYPTKQHLSSLVSLGPSSIHRYSFGRVRRGVVNEIPFAK